MSQSRRVLIRTLPLSALNYGGILQAFALQRILTGMGHSVATDLSTRPKPIARWRHLKREAHTVLSARLPLAIQPERWKLEYAHREIHAPLDDFVGSHIAGVRVFDKKGRVDADLLAQFDTFLTGSDQVWRNRYADVPSYLFDFLPERSPRPRRVSYAASFGKADLSEYGDELITRTAKLAKEFDSLSVREASAVDICRKSWGVETQHHLDPTMLLRLEEYEELTRGLPNERVPRGGILHYTLDSSPAKVAIIGQVQEVLGLPVNSAMPASPSSFKKYRDDPARFIKPSIGQWLRNVSSSDFVVTDSFHGCVFAILFNRPFIALGNQDRGLARFASLLATFELEDRFVVPSQSLLEDVVTRKIDWDRVNQVLKAERDRAFAYLSVAV